MYSLDTDISRRAAKTALIYVLITIFCAIFGAIYEVFSHEVYSFYMIYAFAFPLIGGVLPFLLLCMSKSSRYPNTAARQLYHSGIATFTVGCMVRGVLDIYGTTNSLSMLYWYMGTVLIAAGIIVFLLQKNE